MYFEENRLFPTFSPIATINRFSQFGLARQNQQSEIFTSIKG